ncbi:MAG: monofunctional biosynthetic peptidoglycan transglycosylase [Ignavibacteriaceae bacterium]|nr:monofunctional biosynthetic peptidoglycan transglycosylase [Ignavibacteriaceae bacterium]
MQDIYSSPFELTAPIHKVLDYALSHKFKAGVLYLVFLFYFSLPGLSIPLIEYRGNSVSSLMDQRARESFLFYYPSFSYVDIDNVSPYFLRGVVSMEDGNFFDHKGVDWKELKKSMKVNTRRKKFARGGSTITMQLSKNLYFTTNKSFIRKAKELLVTFRLEKEVSKKAILENYVNIIEWGDGVFGIQKASREYFKKDADELNLNEASRLAAVIPSPLKYKPNTNSGYVTRRASMIRARYSDVTLDF